MCARELGDFLRSGTLLHQDSATWANGTMPLRVSYYLGNREAPRRLVSSVRAIVFNHDQVLVVSQKNGKPYIVPGGRVERGEMPLDTLTREVLEETGWTVGPPLMLGWQHFHHLGPKPADYRYPYPDFVWPIYMAEAQQYIPSAIIPDEYVLESHFCEIDEVRELPVNSGELMLLEGAIRIRRPDLYFD